MQAGPLETKWVSLGDIANLKAGFGFPKIYQGKTTGDYPFAKVGDISRAGRTGTHALHRADHYVDESDLKLMKASTVPAGSVLFAKIGEAIRQEHRVVAECALAIDNNAMAAVPGPLVESRYLFRFLQTVNMYAMASSTTVPSLRKSQLSQIHVPLPPLPEQHRIAAILDKADRLRTQRREALAHLDALTHSIFNDTFGDLDRNTMAWPSAVLKQLLVVGPQNGMYLPSSDYGSGTPIVRIDSFRNGVVDDLATLKRLRASDSDVSRYGLHTGDVLINRVNSIEHLGKAAVVPTLHEPTVFESNMMRCRFDSERINNTFIRFTLQSQQVKRQILRSAKRAVNQASINQTDVKNFMLLVPPLELQQTFTRRVAGVERLKKHHHAHLAELDILFASLQHRAFTGKL